ncbi:MAG TPA: sigma-54 dependent transcriptional regulator [Candidatus Dormibacteraeota bacterium]|nr:sigma-54 dependent transcriptional regulator [Candidatus Dormibacteraeota bacterium]
MSEKPRLVAIDDDEQSLALMREGLGPKTLAMFTATNPEEGLRLVEEKHPEIVVVGSLFAGLCGIDLLEQILGAHPGTDGIILGGCSSTECVVDAIKKGAFDYIVKPDFLDRLSKAVDRLVEKCDQGGRRLRALDELLGSFEFAGIVGQSPLLMSALDTACRIAPHFRTVLITGQTGTGKELTARLLQRMSPVSSRPFVVGNLSALVETLLESELFGHVRGSFTGATHDKVGLCEYANGGTLFLDEIGEMPLGAQTRLLRFLQTQEIQRVGSPQIRQLDVRVIAATNQDLRSLVTQGKFREDLYYRLAVVEIKLPSLAERKGDLPLLERHFLSRFAPQFGKARLRGLTERARLILRRHGWPGNIREFENVLCYACMMAERDLIDIGDLPEHMRSAKAEDMLEGKNLVPLEIMQRRYVRHVLDQMGGKKGLAASVLGINRMKLYRLLKEQPLEVPSGNGSGSADHRCMEHQIPAIDHDIPVLKMGLARAGK